MNPYSSKSYASPHNARLSTMWRTWDKPGEITLKRDETLETSKVRFDAQNRMVGVKSPIGFQKPQPTPRAQRIAIPVKVTEADRAAIRPKVDETVQLRRKYAAYLEWCQKGQIVPMALSAFKVQMSKLG